MVMLPMCAVFCRALKNLSALIFLIEILSYNYRCEMITLFNCVSHGRGEKLNDSQLTFDLFCTFECLSLQSTSVSWPRRANL